MADIGIVKGPTAGHRHPFLGIERNSVLLFRPCEEDDIARVRDAPE